MSAELYDMIYELMLAFGISSIAGIILLIFGMRLWEMRCAELDFKKIKQLKRRSAMLKTANNYRSVYKRCAGAVSESKYGECKQKTGGRPCEYDSEDANVCLTCDNQKCTGTAACMAKRKRMLGK